MHFQQLLHDKFSNDCLEAVTRALLLELQKISVKPIHPSQEVIYSSFSIHNSQICFTRGVPRQSSTISSPEQDDSMVMSVVKGWILI